MSKVFHSFPQVQNHLSSLRGDQPHSGQRMRGPDGAWLFSSSSSRSRTTDDLEGSLTKIELPSFALVSVTQALSQLTPLCLRRQLPR